MTDETKALVEECRLDAKAFRENTVYDSDGDPIRLIANADRLDQYADLIETQAREIERLREALEAYAARCTICSGGGSIVEEDSATGALLWRDCPGCTPALAALAGDSHE